MKLLTRVAATAVIGKLAVGGPALVLGASPSPSAPAGPVAGTLGQWTATAPMIEAHSGHAATLLPDGRVLVVGGYGIVGKLTPAELYDPGSGTSVLVAEMDRPLSAAVLALVDGPFVGASCSLPDREDATTPAGKVLGHEASSSLRG